MHTSQLHSSCAHSAVGTLLSSRQARCIHVVRVQAKAGGNGAENSKVSTDKQREIAKILLQTQKNMLELNNSRVKVQEELAVAHRRIADLERELERMRADQARQQLVRAQEAVLPPPFSSDRGVAMAVPTQAPPAAAAAPPPAQQQQQQMPAAPPQQPQQQQQQHQPPQQQQHQHQQQQQAPVAAAAPAPPPPQPASPPPPALPATINLTYVSGWHNCFIHFSADNKPWTSVPGQRLQASKKDHMVKTISIEGHKLEFVMTNGENDWDSPSRYSDTPKNYVISAPGNYRLKSGKLEQMPADYQQQQ